VDVPDYFPDWLKSAGWGIAIFAVVWRFFVPRRECSLIIEARKERDKRVDGDIDRAKDDLVKETAARHELRNALNPIALQVARVEATVAEMKETSKETRDLVKILVERERS
jgi:septal ring factor EnvC (AmiA/AmiB activator)